MDLHPLGIMAGMPDGGRASSGYLVRDGGVTLQLDAGPGTALRIGAVSPGRLPDAVAITHLHSDHVYDLLPLGKLVLRGRLRRADESAELEIDESVPRTPLFVPRGGADVLGALAALFPVTTHPLLDRAFELAFAVHEYEPGETVDVGHLTLRFELLRHAAPNCGIRVGSPQADLVYTGDTGVTDALPALAEGAGVLLSECTLRESDRSGHGHLSSREAGRAASDAGVGELVLTHFTSADPLELEWHRERAASEFGGPVRIADPGHRIPVTPTRKVSA
ncbi:MBL fold metallo-hydrolase [Myceligenerans pegani]|uniref:MBL fold metallo-hydrolase n=1 Tax=Myceligenerans pegani TaxID=2776917 RepID=A0ABR9MZ19_9MICO|nr:MBL fold metallo-hydrolase [Myceligenerans sp. TRM 65318]MBE1876648.1 MBL fold metallo-hydrolase [Myceligenerans sp. TRM 65318]MBE3018919.1 MBL fold metallo-hydrolase [Myceligenerans sp. TRM 65318]